MTINQSRSWPDVAHELIELAKVELPRLGRFLVTVTILAGAPQVYHAKNLDASEAENVTDTGILAGAGAIAYRWLARGRAGQ